ncbi:MAG: carbamoyltransferase HypF [Bernardetiaceae bacterium]
MITYRIHFRGQVQGVGFRPAVFRMARHLKGSIRNSHTGAVLDLQADEAEVHRFLKQLLDNLPPLAQVAGYDIQILDLPPYTSFAIAPNDAQGEIALHITPDTAPCAACKGEVKETKNRRFAYAFTSCVDCGPRYGIVRQLPFTREQTTLGDFPMCQDCLREYEDPANRRFHAQTISCPACGPKVYLNGDPAEVWTRAKRLLEAGRTLAVKTLTGYLLCVDARQVAAITRLRQAKHRPRKPLALLYPDLDSIRAHFTLAPEQEMWLSQPAAPIVLLSPTEKNPLPVHLIAPPSQRLGVMLPASMLLHVLMQALGFPVVATSGNPSGQPLAYADEAAKDTLHPIADDFLTHTLPIAFPQDDSLIERDTLLLRRGRGYAPTLPASASSATLLAMGSDLKSSFALLHQGSCYGSPYIGNLENYAVQERYVQMMADYLALFRVHSPIVLVDAHPQYHSRLLADRIEKSTLHTVPHHEAHLAAVLGEHQLWNTPQKILGVVWDGMGWGKDGQIWGGEFFTYRAGAMHRVGHWAYFPWLAADKMSRDGRLPLLSLLHETEFESLAWQNFSLVEQRIYRRLLQQPTLYTSSVGRIFDAVALLLGIPVGTFEGEAAMMLEALARRGIHTHAHPLLTQEECQSQQPSPKLLLARVAEALCAGQNREKIAFCFHLTLALLILGQAEREEVEAVACSGGVFQNALLVQLLQQHIPRLYLHQRLPPNDENIAFGQIQHFLHP